MNQVNLAELTEKIETFAKERDWEQFHSVKNLVMALSVEVSELVEIFQWMTEQQSNSAHLDEKSKVRIQEEIADISIYLLRILQKTETNLEAAVLDKLKKNGEKYPVHLAKGKSSKYDQFE